MGLPSSEVRTTKFIIRMEERLFSGNLSFLKSNHTCTLMAAAEATLCDLFPEILHSIPPNKIFADNTVVPSRSDVNSSIVPPEKSRVTKEISYAQATLCVPTNNISWVSDSYSLNPTRKGDYFSISVDDEMYMQRRKVCEDSIIGCLVLSKGDRPWMFTNLQQHLHSVWNIQHSWRMVSLGKGYYNFQFDSEEDRNKVWFKNNWILKSGILRLQQWVPDFNPYKIKSTVVQVWVRIYELSLEYWHYPIIMGIAKSVGNPIKIDENSMSGMYGHYVRVLVEMDLSINPQEHVMIERTGHCLFVSLSYENLPNFCPHCSMVGHSITRCTKFKGKAVDHQKPHASQQKTVYSNKSSKSIDNGCSNAFDPLNSVFENVPGQLLDQSDASTRDQLDQDLPPVQNRDVPNSSSLLIQGDDPHLDQLNQNPPTQMATLTSEIPSSSVPDPLGNGNRSDQYSDLDDILHKLQEFNNSHGQAANVHISSDINSNPLKAMDMVSNKSWASYSKHLPPKPLKGILKKSTGFPPLENSQ